MQMENMVVLTKIKVELEIMIWKIIKEGTTDS